MSELCCCISRNPCFPNFRTQYSGREGGGARSVFSAVLLAIKQAKRMSCTLQEKRDLCRDADVLLSKWINASSLPPSTLLMSARPPGPWHWRTLPSFLPFPSSYFPPPANVLLPSSAVVRPSSPCRVIEFKTGPQRPSSLLSPSPSSPSCSIPIQRISSSSVPRYNERERERESTEE